MGLHHGQNRGQIGNQIRITLLNQLYDDRTVGGNGGRLLGPFLHQVFVSGLDQISPGGCVEGVRQTELFQGFGQSRQAVGSEFRHIGRVKRGDDLSAALDEVMHPGNHIQFFLGVLGTDQGTFLTEDALILQNLCLMVDDPNGLDRAVPDAFIAVSAVYFFKL